MNNGRGDRLDQLQDLLENFLAASVADRIESNRRMTRLEQSMEQFQALVETSYEPVQALLEASTGHDAILASHEEILASHQAMISRLDAILERMVYREGRGNEEGQ